MQEFLLHSQNRVVVLALFFWPGFADTHRKEISYVHTSPVLKTNKQKKNPQNLFLRVSQQDYKKPSVASEFHICPLLLLRS